MVREESPGGTERLKVNEVVNHEDNCAACGVHDRAENSRYCAGCRDALVRADGGTERYAYSQLTDTWYIVHDWEDLGDGKLRAKSKEEVDRSDVPQEWIEATDERSLHTATDPDGGDEP